MGAEGEAQQRAPSLGSPGAGKGWGTWLLSWRGSAGLTGGLGRTVAAAAAQCALELASLYRSSRARPGAGGGIGSPIPPPQ